MEAPTRRRRSVIHGGPTNARICHAANLWQSDEYQCLHNLPVRRAMGKKMNIYIGIFTKFDKIVPFLCLLG